MPPASRSFPVLVYGLQTTTSCFSNLDALDHDVMGTVLSDVYQGFTGHAPQNG